jgi:hypothetical protein
VKRLHLPESKAVKEVRRWRRTVQRRAEKVGWKKYLEEANRNVGWLLGSPAKVVRERPAKYKAR